jgi:hypothetical protein
VAPIRREPSDEGIAPGLDNIAPGLQPYCSGTLPDPEKSNPVLRIDIDGKDRTGGMPLDIGCRDTGPGTGCRAGNTIFGEVKAFDLAECVVSERNDLQQAFICGV